MADVFVSYKREDLAAVQRLVEGLRGAGLTVWWDQDIAPDAPWEATIERALKAAKAVIVAWSPAAVESENVKSEARFARTHGKLIQVFVAPCAPPIFFGERQGVDLSGWSGAASGQRFKTVLEAARAVIAGEKPPQGVGFAPKRRSPWGVLAAIALGVSTALGLVANAGGARDAVCGFEPVRPWCAANGLIATPPPVVDMRVEQEEKARAALLAKINGTWGNAERKAGDVKGLPARPACTITTTYRVERRGDDDVVIVAQGTPEESAGRVLTVDLDRGVVVTRSAAGQTTLTPEGDRLLSEDARGEAKTTLVRCDGG